MFRAIGEGCGNIERACRQGFRHAAGTLIKAEINPLKHIIEFAGDFVGLRRGAGFEFCDLATDEVSGFTRPHTNRFGQGTALRPQQEFNFAQAVFNDAREGACIACDAIHQFRAAAENSFFERLQVTREALIEFAAAFNDRLTQQSDAV